MYSLILISIALAMDCLTVSIASAVILGRIHWPLVIRMSFLFGLFQGLMPLLGWCAISFLTPGLTAYGHWLAFLLLAFVGGRMIVDALRPSHPQTFNPVRLRTQFILAVATSIDAMAIGASYAVLGYDELVRLLLPFTVIGVFSFLFSIAGHLLGTYFGRVVKGYVRPELLGGLILLAIGIKVLLGY